LRFSSRLRRGDILASVRGAEIADVGDFYRKVWRCGEAGVEVPIEIIRDERARSKDQVGRSGRILETAAAAVVDLAARSASPGKGRIGRMPRSLRVTGPRSR